MKEISRFRYGKITGMKSVFSCFRRFPRLPSRFPTHREAGALPWEIQNFLFITVSHLPTVSIRNCTLILFLPAHIFLLVYGPFFLPPRISPMEFMISGWPHEAAPLSFLPLPRKLHSPYHPPPQKSLVSAPMIPIQILMHHFPDVALHGIPIR